MEILRSIDTIPSNFNGSVAAIGNFDGVHLGHQKVFQATKEIANLSQAPSSVITFEPHPREYFQPQSKQFRLTNSKSRAKELESQGIDILFELSFDSRLANMSALEFINELLHKTLQLSHVVVGKDFKFGNRRTGDYKMLEAQGKLLGIGVSSLELLQFDNTTCSSTLIREAITKGEMKKAAQSLGRWFTIVGIVQSGYKRGRQLGYPTANLNLERVIHPQNGIYGVMVNVMTGPYIGRYKGVASIGTNPTFGVHKPNLETYLFDFDGDIYGEEIEVALIHYLRPEIKFETSEMLIDQMRVDCQNAQLVLGENQLQLSLQNE